MINPIENMTRYTGNGDFEDLLDKHFMSEAWYDHDSLIEDYEEEKEFFQDMHVVFGSEEFEAEHGSDPIGCIYVTHDEEIFFVSYL